MNDFVIEKMVNDDEHFLVRQQSTGWFYPNLTHLEAVILCEKFNEVSK